MGLLYLTKTWLECVSVRWRHNLRFYSFSAPSRFFALFCINTRFHILRRITASYKIISIIIVGLFNLALSLSTLESCVHGTPIRLLSRHVYSLEHLLSRLLGSGQCWVGLRSTNILRTPLIKNYSCCVVWNSHVFRIWLIINLISCLSWRYLRVCIWWQLIRVSRQSRTTWFTTKGVSSAVYWLIYSCVLSSEIDQNWHSIVLHLFRSTLHVTWSRFMLGISKVELSLITIVFIWISNTIMCISIGIGHPWLRLISSLFIISSSTILSIRLWSIFIVHVNWLILQSLSCVM